MVKINIDDDCFSYLFIYFSINCRLKYVCVLPMVYVIYIALLGGFL